MLFGVRCGGSCRDGVVHVGMEWGGSCRGDGSCQNKNLKQILYFSQFYRPKFAL